MKFVVEINNEIYSINELEESSFREVSKLDIVGIPVYFTTVGGVHYFWPRPMPALNIFKLERWEYTAGRLA